MQKIPAAPKCTAPKLTAKAMPKLLLGFLPILLSACAYLPAGTVANATTQSSKQPSSEQIYWVSGHKMPCSAGAGKMMCLRGSKHPEFHQASWQYFYTPIEGFVFEAGVAKKIKVHATQLDPKDVPADASATRYRLVAELEKRVDSDMP